MKATTGALLFFSCIMCAQMTHTTYGWGHTQFGYPKLSQVMPLPLTGPIQPQQLNALQQRALVADDEVTAVKQISDGSEKFSFEFFRVRISEL